MSVKGGRKWKGYALLAVAPVIPANATDEWTIAVLRGELNTKGGKSVIVSRQLEVNQAVVFVMNVEVFQVTARALSRLTIVQCALVRRGSR